MIDDKTHPSYTENNHHVANATIGVAGAEGLFAAYVNGYMMSLPTAYCVCVAGAGASSQCTSTDI